MTAAEPYEGGASGIFRRRPLRMLRRAAATPYDRPASAIRGLRIQSAAAAEKNGWLSKLIDQASRIIARSASRNFLSVFQTSPTAPPETPAMAVPRTDENHHSCKGFSEVACTNPSPKVWKPHCSDTVNLVNNSSADGAQHILNSDANGISELEILLKQKTFTRFEFDRLTELLRSRTIESSPLQPTLSYEKEAANVSGQENENHTMRFTRSNGNVPTPVTSLTIPEEEFASPAELAKEYMGSRLSKAPSSALSLRNQLFQEDALPGIIPYGRQISQISTAPKFVTHFSGISEPHQNGYMTPRPIGRLTVHGMSRSPYFRAPSATNIKGSEPYRDEYAPPLALSQRTPINFMQFGGKRVHRRGISVLDNDLRSPGPIRRLRQKFNLISPSKDIQWSHGNRLPDPSTTLTSNGNESLKISVEKPLVPQDYTSDLHDSENEDNKVSRKEKTSQPTTTFRDELPSKLTTSMLQGRALKGMEGIDSSKFLNLIGKDKLDAPSDSDVQNLGSFISLKQGKIANNVESAPSISGVELIETVGAVNPITSTDAKASSSTPDFAISGSVTVSSIRRSAFRMRAPEIDFDLDDDDYNTNEASNRFPTRNIKLEEKVSEGKPLISETANLEKTMPHSSQIKLNTETVMKASDKPFTKGDVGFSFPVAPACNSFSLPPPTPTMPFPLLERSSLQEEQISAPAFIFGSKESNGPMLSEIPAKVSDNSGFKFNASNSTTTDLPDSSCLVNGRKSLEAGNLFETSGIATSSCVSTSGPAAIGLEAPTSLSTSFTSAASAAAAAPFSNVAATSTSLSNAQIATSTTPSFGFGSQASTSTPTLLSTAIKSSNFTECKVMPEEASSVSTSSAISSSGKSNLVLATSAMLSSTTSESSSLFGFSSPAQSSTTTLPVADTSCKTSLGSFGTTSGSIFGSEASVAGVGSSPFSQTAESQFGSSTSAPAFGITGSLFESSSSQMSSNDSGAKPFGSTLLPFTSGYSSSSLTAAASLSSLSSQKSAPSIFGFSASSPFIASASTSSASTDFSFGSNAQAATSSALGSNSSFGSSSQPSTSANFVSSTGASSLGFSFGLSAPALAPSSQSSAAFIFGSSTASSTGFQFGAPGFGSGSPGNDQTNVEDSMTDDSIQATPPTIPPFGQPANALPASNFIFGSSVAPLGGQSVFQFGNPPVSFQAAATQNPFQPAGNLEFSGGSFSLGSGDKSGRKIVRVNRNKFRKK